METLGEEKLSLEENRGRKQRVASAAETTLLMNN